MVRIVVDAMGGDYAPREIVKGSVAAARQYGIAIELVGKTQEIEAELNRLNIKGLNISITDAQEVIEMSDEVGTSIRRKKDASIVKAADSVAKGNSQALVAAGSTGAAMAACLLGWGRLPSIDRPAIACVIPTLQGKTVLLDAGANSECTPNMLYQFAIMGRVFSREIVGVKNPRTSIVNIGEEASKGNELTKEAYKILNDKKELLNFTGNIEGRDIFKGASDVVVCDGFVGNVILKVTEGVASMLLKLLKDQLVSSVWTKFVAFLAKPILMKLKKNTDYEEYGGALLLGVKGICVIAHGGSKARAIKNAIRVAKESVEHDINGKIANLYETNKING